LHVFYQIAYRYFMCSSCRSRWIIKGFN